MDDVGEFPTQLKAALLSLYHHHYLFHFHHHLCYLRNSGCLGNQVKWSFGYLRRATHSHFVLTSDLIVSPLLWHESLLFDYLSMNVLILEGTSTNIIHNFTEKYELLTCLNFGLLRTKMGFWSFIFIR